MFSFLNVVAYRLPRSIDFIKGRSRCNECAHELTALDTVPVLSYLFLGGKCRYCKGKLSPQYLIIEIIGGAFAVFCSLYYYPNILKTITAFAFISILVLTALVDWETMEIPNGFVLTVAIIGLLSLFTFREITVLQRLIGVLCVSLPLFIITLIIPNAFGGGDIKLMAASGLVLGWKLNLTGFLIAVLTGGIYAIYLLAAKKADKKDHFAFGPFLCVGLIISLFAGNIIIAQYLSLF